MFAWWNQHDKNYSIISPRTSWRMKLTKNVTITFKDRTSHGDDVKTGQCHLVGRWIEWCSTTPFSTGQKARLESNGMNLQSTWMMTMTMTMILVRFWLINPLHLSACGCCSCCCPWTIGCMTLVATRRQPRWAENVAETNLQTKQVAGSHVVVLSKASATMTLR
jgi:hypothetical protein